MIRNVIFDIGNVLTDFRWKDFLKDKGFEGEVLERIAKASVESPVWSELDRGVWSFEQVMEGFIRNAPDLEQELHRAFDDMTDIVTIRPYAVDWVKELKKQDMKVYFLSNFSQKIEAECMDALCFREEMDGGLLSYQEKRIKPDPEFYRLLLERYDLKPWECVFLDDMMVNVNAARAFGIYGIVFQNKDQATAEFEELIKMR